MTTPADRIGLVSMFRPYRIAACSMSTPQPVSSPKIRAVGPAAQWTPPTLWTCPQTIDPIDFLAAFRAGVAPPKPVPWTYVTLSITTSRTHFQVGVPQTSANFRMNLAGMFTLEAIR